MDEQAVFDALKYRVDVDMFGTRRYYNSDNQLHRMGGPAVEFANGAKYWYQNGQYHRTDGPAAEVANGAKYWYQNGQYHRTDGPAIMWPDGHKWWYLNDWLMSEAEFNQAVKAL